LKQQGRKDKAQKAINNMTKFKNVVHEKGMDKG
jgi:hypothetical protein